MQHSTSALQKMRMGKLYGSERTVSRLMPRRFRQDE
jgi:hypothetical protein